MGSKTQVEGLTLTRSWISPSCESINISSWEGEGALRSTWLHRKDTKGLTAIVSGFLSDVWSWLEVCKRSERQNWWLTSLVSLTPWQVSWGSFFQLLKAFSTFKWKSPSHSATWYLKCESLQRKTKKKNISDTGLIIRLISKQITESQDKLAPLILYLENDLKSFHYNDLSLKLLVLKTVLNSGMTLYIISEYENMSRMYIHCI